MKLKSLGISLFLLCCVTTYDCSKLSAAEKYAPFVPVSVEVYYEAMCPDSKNLIVNQLLPLTQNYPTLVTVELIPYGFGQTTINRKTKQWEFGCQHGSKECLGNKIHACGIHVNKNQDVQLKFVGCMMNNYRNPSLSAGEKCAKESKIAWKPIQKCLDSRKGDSLLAAHGVKTSQLQPPTTFIPATTLNKKRYDHDTLLKFFHKEVCKLLLNQPEECRSFKQINPDDQSQNEDQYDNILQIPPPPNDDEHNHAAPAQNDNDPQISLQNNDQHDSTLQIPPPPEDDEHNHVAPAQNDIQNGNTAQIELPLEHNQYDYVMQIPPPPDDPQQAPQMEIPSRNQDENDLQRDLSFNNNQLHNAPQIDIPSKYENLDFYDGDIVDSQMETAFSDVYYNDLQIEEPLPTKFQTDGYESPRRGPSDSFKAILPVAPD